MHSICGQLTPGRADCQPYPELFGAELAGEGWRCASVCWESWSPRGSMSLQVPTPQNGTCRNSPEPTQPQPHLASPDLRPERWALCAVSRWRECFLRTQQCDMNSKTHPFLQKCSANPLTQTHPVCLSGCTTGLLLVRLLCKKYFSDLCIQQSQQTRKQSQKARARAGGTKARGVGTEEGERSLSHSRATSFYTDTAYAEMQLWDSLAKIPMTKISRMLRSTTSTPGSGP